MRFYPFVSTGKERDEETGYGYFGARYMDHELMTMWLSVDPMADKYPSVSPYAYCAWNPVKLVDPNGMDTVDVTFDGKKDIASYRYSEACQVIGIDSYDLLGGYVMLGTANTVNASCGVARYFGAESPNATYRMTNKPNYPFQVYWSNTSRVSSGRNIFKNRPCLNF